MLIGFKAKLATLEKIEKESERERELLHPGEERQIGKKSEWDSEQQTGCESSREVQFQVYLYHSSPSNIDALVWCWETEDVTLVTLNVVL